MTNRKAPFEVTIDNDAEAEFMVPRLTTIDPDNDAMAQAVVDLVLDQIRNGPRSVAARDHVSGTRLVVRESTRSS